MFSVVEVSDGSRTCTSEEIRVQIGKKKVFQGKQVFRQSIVKNGVAIQSRTALLPPRSLVRQWYQRAQELLLLACLPTVNSGEQMTA